MKEHRLEQAGSVDHKLKGRGLRTALFSVALLAACDRDGGGEVRTQDSGPKRNTKPVPTTVFNKITTTTSILEGMAKNTTPTTTTTLAPQPTSEAPTTPSPVVAEPARKPKRTSNTLLSQPAPDVSYSHAPADTTPAEPAPKEALATASEPAVPATTATYISPALPTRIDCTSFTLETPDGVNPDGTPAMEKCFTVYITNNATFD